jgi:hypothetical protein
VTATAFQHEFAAALLVPARRAPAGIRSGSRLERERRFAVHRNNVVVSLIDALAETFPVSQALVGEAFFRAMARERVLTDPPRSPVLTDYAEGFPDFVAGFAPAASVPYLADVARIEALRVRAYHAADAQPVAESVYRELLAAPETLAAARLTLHPAGRWLRSGHAAYSIWQAHQGREDLSDADLDGIHIDHAEDVLVARPALDVTVTALPGGAIEFLDALGDGHPLAAAFAAARAAVGDIDHGALFAVLIQYGLAVVVDTSLEP